MDSILLDKQALLLFHLLFISLSIDIIIQLIGMALTTKCNMNYSQIRLRYVTVY